MFYTFNFHASSIPIWNIDTPGHTAQCDCFTGPSAGHQQNRCKWATQQGFIIQQDARTHGFLNYEIDIIWTNAALFH